MTTLSNRISYHQLFLFEIHHQFPLGFPPLPPQAWLSTTARMVNGSRSRSRSYAPVDRGCATMKIVSKRTLRFHPLCWLDEAEKSPLLPSSSSSLAVVTIWTGAVSCNKGGKLTDSSFSYRRLDSLVIGPRSSSMCGLTDRISWGFGNEKGQLVDCRWKFWTHHIS